MRLPYGEGTPSSAASVRPAPGRCAAFRCSSAHRLVGGRSARGRIRSASTAVGPRPAGGPVPRHGLADTQRVHARPRHDWVAGVGVAVLRRLHGRHRSRSDDRSHSPSRRRHRRGQRPMPDGRRRFRPTRRCTVESRPARSNRGIGMGPAQYRQLRRRPDPCHRRRGIRRSRVSHRLLAIPAPARCFNGPLPTRFPDCTACLHWPKK